jgi:hypothetical protein
LIVVIFSPPVAFTNSLLMKRPVERVNFLPFGAVRLILRSVILAVLLVCRDRTEAMLEFFLMLLFFSLLEFEFRFQQEFVMILFLLPLPLLLMLLGAVVVARGVMRVEVKVKVGVEVGVKVGVGATRMSLVHDLMPAHHTPNR